MTSLVGSGPHSSVGFGDPSQPTLILAEPILPQGILVPIFGDSNPWVPITESAYAALSPPDPDTLYVVIPG